MAFKSWRFPIRLAASLLAAMMLAVLLVAASLAWMAASQSGTRAAFALLRLGTGGMIEARGIQGRLIGPLQIDELRIDLPASATQAATLPASLRLPLTFRIDPIKIAHLRIQKQGKEMLEADSFSGRLEFDGQRYRAGLQNVHLIRIAGKPVSGKLAGSLTLAADAPFAIAAELRLSDMAQPGQQALQADGTIQLQGELAALNTQFHVQLGRGKSGMAANGKLVLQPFSPSVIRQADLHASDINLALLNPVWPLTRMTLSATLEPGGQGKVSIKNTGAGALDQHRLPVSQADLQIRFTDQTIRLTALDVNNGVLQGSGHIAQASAELKLTLHALNLKQIDTRLRETRLTGDISLKRSGNKDAQLRLALAEPWQRMPLKLQAEAAINENQATISTASLQHGKASASLSASIEFNGAQRFAFEGKFDQLRMQDFGQFSGWPEIMLNGHAEASGNLTARPQATIFFSLTDSRIDGHPLHGDGKLMLDSRQLLIPHLQLALGANLLTAQGALQETGGDLQFSLHAPQLAQLGPHFGGALQLEGRVTGSFRTPLLSMKGQVQHLALPGATSIEALHLQLQAGLENNAPLVLQLDARHIASGKLHVQGLSLQSAGTIAQHQLTASLTTGKQNLVIAARGGVNLKEGKSWQGQLTKAGTSGKFSAHLEKPASLFLSLQRQQIDVFSIASDYGQLNLESFRRDATGITTRGTLVQLLPAALLSLFGQSVVQSGDLRLNGAWNLQLSSHDQTPWQGTLSLQRTAGDLILRSQQAIALGLQNLVLTLSAKDNRIHAAFTANGKQLGQLSFAGSARTKAEHSLLPDLRAPLAGELNLQLPAIDWIASLFSPGLIAQGSVSSKLAISGSWSAPEFKGQLRAQQLRLLMINSGIDLRNGVLEGEFTDSTLEIRQLQFAGSSGNGTVSATGPLRFQDNTLAAKLAWRADGFSVFDRTDRKLIITGDGQFSLMNAQAALTGNVLVDSGFFDIGREGIPQLSDDVIVAGQPPADSRKLALDMNVVVGLGQQLVIKGRGLDARLGGAVQFASKAGSALTARGLMQVTRGTYKAYGRELAIERGILRFDGAPGNPALDIRAMRRGMEVEAGVSIGGTAMAPRVALVSEPQVPDAEKLSWLVLGQGLATASGNDLGALQGAATSLLSQGAAAGVQAQLATAFGLDSISLSNSKDSLQQRIITLGKRVSSRLYVSYQQSLQSAGSAVLLRYTLSSRLTVEAETGNRSVFSLFYNMRFD